MRTWTPEARKAQAEAIRRWKPWTRSTGPKTQAGKETVSRNARGPRYEEKKVIKHLNHWLTRQSRYRKAVELLWAIEKKNYGADQTIMKLAVGEEGDRVCRGLTECLIRLIQLGLDRNRYVIPLAA